MSNGTYVGINVSKFSEKHLRYWWEVINKMPPMDKNPHITIAYSRKEIDYKNNYFNFMIEVNSSTYKYEFFDNRKYGYKRSLVLKLDHWFLHEEFNKCMNLGATWDYDNYTPHVTLLYDCPDYINEYNLPALPKQTILLFTRDIFKEELNE